MLTLRSSPSSPFVRKVRIASSVLALDSDIKVERADTSDPSDTVRRQNPLGKIPALLLEDGSVLFDSRVILEYLARADICAQANTPTHPTTKRFIARSSEWLNCLGQYYEIDVGLVQEGHNFI